MALAEGWYLKRLNGNQETVGLWAADTNFRLRVLTRHSVEGGHEVPTPPDHHPTDEQLIRRAVLFTSLEPLSLCHLFFKTSPVVHAALIAP